jgi:hypothetical protein
VTSWARVAGLTLVLVALVTHRSGQHRPVLGRWSYLYAVVVLTAAAGTGIALWRAISRRSRRRPTEAACFDFAVLLWGTAYLLAALDTPASAARILDLNVVGSIDPPAVLLEWGALASALVGLAVWASRRVPGRWINPAVSVAAVATLALLGEGVARLRAVIVPATQGFQTYRGLLWLRHFVRLNQLGFRDREHAVAPPAGTRRLALIGDSFAYGMGIDRVGDRFGERLGNVLERATGERWEVINAAVPDSHTLDEIARLDTALAFRPDAVILLYVFNDIDYLRRVVERSILTRAPRTPLDRLHPLRVLFRNSYLFQELYLRFRPLAEAHRWDPSPYADSAIVTRHLLDLGRFVAKAASGGAVVGIVPLDHTVSASPDLQHRYDEFVRRATAVGLPVWRVDQAFASLPVTSLTVNRWDFHPNPLANRLAADAAAPSLIAALRQRPLITSAPPRSPR